MSVATTKPKKKRLTLSERVELLRQGPVLNLPEGKLWEVVIVRDGEERVATVDDSRGAQAYMNSFNFHGVEERYAFAREVRAVRVKGGAVVSPIDAGKGGAP